MWKLTASAVGFATLFVALAQPSTAHAQNPGDGWSRGGLGNILFDRWVDNRRAARGIPTTQLYYYDPEEGDGILNRLFDRWIDNRRAARGISSNGYGYETRGYRWSGHDPAPVVGYEPAPATASDNVVRLRLFVAPDARVWVENKEVISSGPVREMESPPLSPGKEFTYHIRVQWRDKDGKDVTRTRNVDVRANDRFDLDMMRPPS